MNGQGAVSCWPNCCGDHLWPHKCVHEWTIVIYAAKAPAPCGLQTATAMYWLILVNPIDRVSHLIAECGSYHWWCSSFLVHLNKQTNKQNKITNKQTNINNHFNSSIGLKLAPHAKSSIRIAHLTNPYTACNPEWRVWHCIGQDAAPSTQLQAHLLCRCDPWSCS